VRAFVRRERLLVAGLLGTLLAGAAAAQTVDTRRARTLVVGMPTGGAPVDRVDRGRTGQAQRLPSSGLRVEWQSSMLGLAIEQGPLVDPAGITYVLGSTGDVVAIGHDGAELWRASTGVSQPGPGALLSDGSLVFVASSGAAVAVRDGRVRWVAHFGRPDPQRPAPLPLEDGGVVVATSRELALLDAEGNERARAALPEPTTSPLVSALGRVVVVAATGTLYAWDMGGEPARIGSFGSPTDQGAALADDHTLVAVTSGHTHLTAVDLAHGTTVTRAIAPAGAWLGPPATARGVSHLLALTQTSILVVGIDASGSEVRRTVLSSHPALLGADGGPIAIAIPPHVPPLVDASGVVAFATAEGAGVAVGSTVDTAADICPAAGGGMAAGLAPLQPAGFVLACRAGSVIAFRGR
jgi:hypothetical protein